VTEAAREQKVDPVSVEGLEEVFLASEVSDNSSESLEEETSEASEVSGIAREVITTEEAAQRLGISARAVINRLKAGTLVGEKVKGKYRKEWRVYWEEAPNDSETDVDVELDTSEASEGFEKKGSEEVGTGRSNDSEVIDRSIASVLLEQNRQLMEQLNALTYRNGYLEAQAESHKEQIKLLTDSQSKTGWWQRFSAWFFRGKA